MTVIRVVALLLAMVLSAAAAELPVQLTGSRPAAARPLEMPAYASISSRVQQQGSVRVIVRLVAPPELAGGFAAEGLLQGREAIAAQRAAAARVRERVLSQVSARHAAEAKRYDFIPYVALEVDQAELQALASSEDVDLIEEDRINHPMLKDSVPLIGADSQRTFSGFSGSGQVVAILDTGVDKTHPFLTGKVVAEACYSNSDGYASAYCTNGSTAAGSGLPCADLTAGCDHGTHVAGIVAGSNGTLAAPSGVAKDASLIAIQVFSRFTSPQDCSPDPAPCAAAYDSDIIHGLQHVYSLRNSYAIAAANLSLGGGNYSATCDSINQPTKAAIDSLRAVGIATVIASGNDGVSSKISSPACISTAISVGATTKADAVASYSNSASFLSLLAPGSAITSSVPGGTYESWNGTSMATPHVAGAWAVLKSAKPSAGVTELLNALTTTGLQITDPRNGIAKPRIRLDRAVELVAIPIATVAPAAGGFGDVVIGGSSTPLEFAVSNSGGQDLVISSIVVAGGSSSMFALNLAGGAAPCGAAPLTLASAGHCTFTITFSPTVIGPQAATLSLATNAPASPVMNIALSGGGTAIYPVLINGGAASTTSPGVQLNLNYVAFTPVSMQLLVDKAAAWSAWKTFAPSTAATLPAGSGQRSVSVRFKDGAGNVSPIYSASIFLDSLAPSGSISIENGAGLTSSPTVALSLTVADQNSGPLWMRFSTTGTDWSGWEPFAATRNNYPLASLTTGLKKIYAQFKAAATADAVGRVSRSYVDSIWYQPELPAAIAGNVSIASSKAGDPSGYTTTTAVLLTLTPPAGESLVRLGTDGSRWGAWLAVPLTAMRYTLPGGDGVKMVYAQYKAAGAADPTTSYRAVITLDTIAPTGWILINDGVTVSKSPLVTVTSGGADVNGLAAKICIKESTAACSPAEFIYDYGVAFPYPIQSTGDGTKNLYARFMDRAGRISAASRATIIVDSTAPTGTLVINGGNDSASTTVPVRLTATKAVYMRFSLDGGTSWSAWEPFAALKTMTLVPDTSNLMSVAAEFKDFAGNTSVTPITDTIRFLP